MHRKSESMLDKKKRWAEESKRMNECELKAAIQQRQTHQHILCRFLVCLVIALTDALGLKCFDLLSDLDTEGRRDGPGVDLGAAADGAGGEGRCLAGRDHGS